MSGDRVTGSPQDAGAQDPGAQDPGGAAGPLDLLLTDAALGVVRRFRPDGSLLRLGAALGRRPR
ncbi:MAG: hypothetical protein M3Z75_31030, partial [Actinomycetota bacterium]|nr:hypothetical protein [Actinomycetota bacterium]